MTTTKKDHPETEKQPANDREVYKVGYGKPPLHSRWRKGQRPHRKGPGPRKRGQMEDYRALFDRISNETITIYENGSATCVHKRHLLATTIVDRGIAGDAECENILIRIEQPDLRPPAGARHVVSVDSEEEIPALQRALLRRKKYRNPNAPSPARFGRGRPRNDAPFAELIKRELNKRIKVQENGRVVTMTKREAWLRRLYNDAINGSPRALRIYMKLVKPTDAPPEDSFFWIIGG
jgi:hypothetical protein